ncbi:Carboxylesterase [Actinidia chinensis var. chinensis]|uniref:Carboxylesterase n=1 Tax=Actinidia chinensis var. chinensis TaxID=1590841 RepID=A0A2R6Q466_ACTCC|nr:Carboxylesterase [Actinidia chinensis var. chinensis]
MGSLPQLVEDCQGILQLFSDGSIFRSNDIHFPMPLHHDATVTSTDHLFHIPHNLHLRLYKPTTSTTTTFPILLFLHGGGFCVGSRTWPNFHNSCLRLASALPAIVLSPDYRLAPEHRLPAALEDAVSALEWVQAQSRAQSEVDMWQGVDFGRVFVVGDSSGGNIAHHLAVRLGVGSPELAPVTVRGYVLMAPFFGGTVRTKAEAEGPPEPMINLEVLDRFWRLSLPAGETADHPLANPFGPNSPNLKPIALDPILVIVGGREMLKDRVEDYARRLKELGKKIEHVEFEGKQHGFFTNEPYSDVANKVLQVIKNFILMNSN